MHIDLSCLCQVDYDFKTAESPNMARGVNSLFKILQSTRAK
jgi:hypothetical protein